MPLSHAVVDWKWRFVRRVLVWELALFLLWTASFYAFALAYRVRPRSGWLVQSGAVPHSGRHHACLVVAGRLQKHPLASLAGDCAVCCSTRRLRAAG